METVAAPEPERDSVLADSVCLCRQVYHARHLRADAKEHRDTVQINGDYSVVDKPLSIVETDLKSRTQKVPSSSSIKRKTAVPRCCAHDSLDSQYARLEGVE